MNVLKALHCTIVSTLSVETLMAALSVIVYLVTINHYQEETLVKVYCHTMHNNIYVIISSHNNADIDECTRSPCENAICMNTEGSFICQCQPPYFNADNSNECLCEAMLVILKK